MRKVSETVVKAFLAGQEKRVGNTYTNGIGLYLHGNCIAIRDTNGELKVSTAGWNTNTTRDRLNCLFSFLPSFGYEVHITSVFQRKGSSYFAMTNGINVSCDGWVVAGVLREAAKVG